MKKIVLGFALLLSVLGLAACSSGEEQGVKPAAQQTASATVAKGDQVSSLKDNEVVFNYEGKDVKGKQLKEFADEYMTNLGESKKFDKESVAKRYILKNELMKYSGLTQEAIDESYKSFVERYEGSEDLIDMSKGSTFFSDIQKELLFKDYSFNEELMDKYYNNLSEGAKANVSRKDFATNYGLVYKNITEDKAEYQKLKDFQQKLLNDSGANGIDLKVQDEKTELIL
ncbi:hypothetical protein [Peribacillus simplex]|uniref:hypothetical protein n=1 Tax=Peribacillus simplex TaxID=1478 RepID=UPI00333B960D